MNKYTDVVKNTGDGDSMQDALRHRALANPLRLRILRVLSAAGPLDVGALAAHLALRPNALRRHLDLLVEAGLASVGPASAGRPGRPRLLYQAGPDIGGARQQHAGYPLLADMLAGSLQRLEDVASTEIEGRLWGRRLVELPLPPVPLSVEAAQVKLTEMLDRLGFAPESHEAGGEIRIDLRRCPFLDTAKAFPGIVCSLHLGLMQGALAELGAPLEAERLDPLVEPTLCIAHLRRAS
jgi:predicted ArsR family transcriptional regulator